MTSRISSTSMDDPRGESPIPSQARIDRIKQSFVEDKLLITEFEELLDAALTGGPPYLASKILEDPRTNDVPTPDDIDERVVKYKEDYYTILGGVARVRETPDWETVINVTGEGTGPNMDEVTVKNKSDTLTDEAKERQEELRRQILGGGERL